MAHPLEDVMREAEPVVLIGDSSEERFPAFSFHAYTKMQKRFYCLDLGGLKESRGKTQGGKVYRSVEELPDDRGDLALIWVHPRSAKKAVDVAHQAGCKRVWFSFKTGHKEAVDHARSLDMNVVEIGRCPIYYCTGTGMPIECRGHIALVKLSGTYSKPPQIDPTKKRRELI